jgi:pentatricopeptide repeat protein
MLQGSIRPNVIACNAAIDSCEKGRQWQLALNFLELMTLGELEPDVISFNSAIRCLEAGCQWQKALKLCLVGDFKTLHMNLSSFIVISTKIVLDVDSKLT